MTNFYCGGSGITAAAGDVDGDGRADLICHNGSGGGPYNGYTWVARALTASEGLGFHSLEQWQAPNASPITQGTFCGFAENVFGLADFDGDGRDDEWCFDHSYGNTYVHLSSGSAANGFYDPYNSMVSIWMPSWCQASLSTVDFGTADFNGDSFADLYCHNRDTAALYVVFGRGEYLSGGFQNSSQPIGGFRMVYASPTSLGGAIGTVCPGQFSVGDFNGDGRSDVLCHDAAGTTRTQFVNYSNTVGANYLGAVNSCESNVYSATVWSLSTPATVLSYWCGSPLIFGSGR